jgi:hypothetical protein
MVIRWLKPNTIIAQSAPSVHQLTYSGLQHFDGPDFGIDLPAGWKATTKPVGDSQGYSWQSAVNETDGQTLEIFKDTLPTTFPVNRLLIIAPGPGRLEVKGGASPDCTTFVPPASPAPDRLGVEAKWQGVTFLCDQRRLPRTVIGTGSTDGINTINLKSPTGGPAHKFFFSYNDFTGKGDYSVFYEALRSLRLK